MVRRALRVGLWASVILGVPLTPVQFWGDELLLALGQSRDTAALAQRYLDGLAWCMVPSWFFMALRNFMGAVNRPEPGLWITLAAIPANALLAYALIYGAFGLPRLDLLGAGLATTIVNVGDVRRRHLGVLRAAGRSANIRCSAAGGAPTGSSMRQLVVVGAADVGRVPARVRRVRGGRATDGLDRHGGADRAPDRAADRRR